MESRGRVTRRIARHAACVAQGGAGESVLRRAVRIFEAFSHESTSVSQIARSADLHVATASRLVAELVDLKLLSREPDRRVRLGLRLWELASRASPGRNAEPVEASTEAGDGLLDGVEVLDDPSEVLDPGAPQGRGARVVRRDREGSRVEVGRLDHREALGGPGVGQR